MKNNDKFNKMTAEEKAEILSDLPCNCCIFGASEAEEQCDGKCYDNILKWLESEGTE